MRIDEAIEEYKSKTKFYDDVGETDIAAKCLQISEWLRQARGAEAASEWYTNKLRQSGRTTRKLLTENSKLSALCIDMFVEFVMEHGSEDDIHEYRSRLHDLGVEVDK